MKPMRVSLVPFKDVWGFKGSTYLIKQLRKRSVALVRSQKCLFEVLYSPVQIWRISRSAVESCWDPKKTPKLWKHRAPCEEQEIGNTYQIPTLYLEFIESLQRMFLIDFPSVPANVRRFQCSQRQFWIDFPPFWQMRDVSSAPSVHFWSISLQISEIGFRNSILHVLTVKIVYVSVSFKMAEMVDLTISRWDFFVVNE